MKRLENKVCILTGGSHGIGKVTCLRLAEEGAEVAIPQMRSNGGGSIVNLSSSYGILSAPDIPPYRASKGAVREMSKTDAVLYAKEGIRVNSVHPGFIWRPLVKEMAEVSEGGPEAFHAYLDSDDAKCVTGSELAIDGGYTAR